VEVPVSVVIPVHNEAENVGPLTAELAAALDGRLEYEIVFVDDGSDDGTAERLAELAPSVPGLRIVRHPARRGQSSAVLSGVRAARGDWVVTLDGDGQSDPADIPGLLAVLHDAGPSTELRLVNGHRRRRRDSRIKLLSSRIANRVRRCWLKDATPDSACGLKLFHRAAFLALPHFDHMHRFLPALFLMSGWRIASVPVNDRSRRHGRSHYGLFDRLWIGIVDLAGVLWLQRRVIRAVPLGETHDP
jgi:dolichol-phosphate mannosyltransferase